MLKSLQNIEEEFLMVNQLPPDHLQQFVGGNFEQVGKEFLTLFQQFGGLKQNDSVLDVGSGVGRMAVPLTTFLSTEGLYRGFDISKEGIDWSIANISSEYPHFQFEHINIYNHLYNPNGSLTSTGFHFPYEADTFNFVFLTSIFTHLMEDEMTHYLHEINRVMKKDGTCLLTMFIVNDEATDLIKAGKSSLQFPHKVGEASIENLALPNAAVGYSLNTVEAMMNKTNFVRSELKFGSWCGRTQFTTYQDLLVLKKKR